MNKMILKSLMLTSFLYTGAFAYDATEVNVKWDGYKTAAKTAVSGVFDKVQLSISKNDDFSKFLSSANVTIDAASLNSKMKFRDNNIISTLFKMANIAEIKGKVTKVSGDDKKGTVDIEIDMNNVKKVIPFNYTVSSNVINAKADINVLDFAMQKSFDAFSLKCKPFHANKTWSDVTVHFELPYK